MSHFDNFCECNNLSLSSNNVHFGPKNKHKTTIFSKKNWKWLNETFAVIFHYSVQLSFGEFLLLLILKQLCLFSSSKCCSPTKELHPSLMTWKLSHDIVSKCKLDFHFPFSFFSHPRLQKKKKKSRQDKGEKSFFFTFCLAKKRNSELPRVCGINM